MSAAQHDFHGSPGIQQAAPYLSLVVASRHDDHGGGLLRRMQAFVDNFLGQCRRHQLDAELVLVEWNPPADRPRLAAALRWPADPRPASVRIIEVPPEVHRRCPLADKLDLLQMLAKNVGIRRARGRFILAANIDLLFSDELMAFLAARRLEPGTMYRIDRHDVEAHVPDGDLDAQLAYCRNHLLRINRRAGTFPLTPDGQPTLFPQDIVPSGQGLLPGAGWYPVDWQNAECFRWAADRAEIAVAEKRADELLLEIEPGPGVGYRPFELQVHDAAGRRLAVRRIAGRCRLNVPAASGRIVLHVPDGRRPTPNDPRILSFRAFFLGWAGTALSPPLAVLAAHDIAASEVGVRFGSGWYDVEQGRDGPFRWAGQDARLFVRPPDGPVRPLTLLVEPGPGVAYRSFILEVRDDTGRCVRRQRVDGWRPLVLHLPVESGRERCWTLHVRGGHQLAEADGRLLNFRVFAPVRWGRQRWPTVRHLLQPLRALQSRSTLATVRTAAHFACPEPLHLGTAGDFTLMARAHWFAVRGYPQFAVFPLHVDTLLCYQAHHSGARETILQDPLRLYHIEHGFGTAWIGPGVSPIVQRLAAEGIPSLGAGQVLRWATEMRRRGRPLLFNAADWGLADLDLPES